MTTTPKAAEERELARSLGLAARASMECGALARASGGEPSGYRRAATFPPEGPRSPTRLLKGGACRKPSNLEAEGVAGILLHPLSLLLLCLPFGWAARYGEWGEVWVFWLNFFGMIPLAKILGDATEELAAALRNDMLAGLLNATFGNVVELVLVVQSLRQGLFEVVKATLLGSVLSNMLLVLGMSFFFGGIVGGRGGKAGGDEECGGLVSEKVQRFQVLGAMVNVSMLLLACLSFVTMTVFWELARGADGASPGLLPVSRASAAVVGSSYVAYVVFQLGTHRQTLQEEDEEEEEEPKLSVRASCALLLATTVLVAASSELLVEAIRGVVQGAHLGQHFIGIVLLPIIGNACEHAAAVRFAMRDKLGLSIGIAVGSSTQIALFAAPFSVLAGWGMGLPVDLNFGALNTSVMTLSVIVVMSMVVNGQSNWLQGYLLMAAYAVVAICYWHLPN